VVDVLAPPHRKGGLRIAFFGTPAFAVPTLDALVDASHEVVAAIAQPDRPSGRGQRLTPGAVKARAIALGLQVLQPEKLRRDELEGTFRALRADLAVVAAYGKILPQWLLDVPRLGMLNVHASLLPKYRGAAPVHRAIIAGETETGVTIMRVVRALDAGPMLDRVVRSIDPDETSDVVERDLAVLGAQLLVRTIDAIREGRAHEEPQGDALASYAARLTREDGRIDWSQPARLVHNRIRGLHPWPHAFTHLDGVRYIIRRSRVVDRPPGATPAVSDRTVETRESSFDVAQDDPQLVEGARGTIADASHGRLAVVCGDGVQLEVVEIQAEGRRPMTAREFLAGHPLSPGKRFE
jgi:methionyl-tRNA formyltransferase